MASLYKNKPVWKRLESKIYHLGGKPFFWAKEMFGMVKWTIKWDNSTNRYILQNYRNEVLGYHPNSPVPLMRLAKAIDSDNLKKMSVFN